MSEILFTKKQKKITPLTWDSKNDWNIIAKYLKKNEIALGGSDTVLGLLARCSNETFEKLNSIKKRPDKPYIVLVNTLSLFSSFIVDDTLKSEVLALAKKITPGPVTFIVKPNKDLPEYLYGGKSTLAVRIPNHAGLCAVIGMVGPLFSTSANVSGQPTPERLQDVDTSLLEQVTCIIENGESLAQPSTIIDCTTDPFCIVREGAYPVAMLERAYGKSFGKKTV